MLPTIDGVGSLATEKWFANASVLSLLSGIETLQAFINIPISFLFYPYLVELKQVEESNSWSTLRGVLSSLSGIEAQ